MGLFKKSDKKSKDEASAEKSGDVIISMPLFDSGEPFSLEKIVDDLKSHWNLNVSDFDRSAGDNTVAVFGVEKERVAVAFMDAPIPPEEFENIVGFNYLWKNAKEELETLRSHAIVTVLSSESSIVERYKILTKLNASILRTTGNSIGVYQGNQTLLLPKELYMDYADALLDNMLPVPLWVYVGIVNSRGSIYTYGMKEFGKDEMEVIDAAMSGSELYDFLLPIMNYVIESDVTLNDGETIGFSAEQKIPIEKSKAVFLDGESLKLKV